MNNFFLVLTLLVFCQGNNYGQARIEIPNVENPNLSNSPLFSSSLIETLQSEYYIKTTKTFELKEDVRSIIETISSDRNDENPIQTINYTFLENNFLLAYKEDTLNGFISSNSKIEKYLYDSTESKLLRIEYLNGLVGINTKKVTCFDIEGYLVEEKFEKYQTGSWSDKKYEKNIFDYILTYEWNENKDTVELFYNYKTEKTYYQRFKNRLHSFVQEEQILDQNRHDIEKGIYEIRSSLFTEERIEYDKNFNIVSRNIFDNSIKGSYNIQQLFEYKYNQNNELIEVSYSTTGPKPEYELQYKFRIEYREFDEKGNWISKIVTTTSGANSYVYKYERELLYY